MIIDMVKNRMFGIKNRTRAQNSKSSTERKAKRTNRIDVILRCFQCAAEIKLCYFNIK